MLLVTAGRQAEFPLFRGGLAGSVFLEPARGVNNKLAMKEEKRKRSRC